MRIIPATERHFQWMESQSHLRRLPDEKGIVAESESGRILGMFSLNTWIESSVQVHSAISTPMCFRGYTFITELFNYIYVVTERLTAVAMVRSKNTKALKLNKHIGFTEVGRIRDGVRQGEDIVILELHKDDCVWINQKEVAA